MKAKFWVVVAVLLAVLAGIAAMAVAETGPLAPAGDDSLTITPAAHSSRLTSFTYWINGEKHTVNNPGGTITINAEIYNQVMFSGQGLYTGPKGSHGYMVFYDSSNPAIRQWKLLKEGVKATMTMDYFYSVPGTGGTKLFYIDAYRDEPLPRTSYIIQVIAPSP